MRDEMKSSVARGFGERILVIGGVMEVALLRRDDARDSMSRAQLERCQRNAFSSD